MKPSTTVSLLTTLTLSTLSTANILKRADCPAYDAPVCETSDGSPDVVDCQDTIFTNTPDNLAGGCAQPHGSGCHTETTYGSCQQVFCQDGESDSSVMCFPEDQTHCIGEINQALIDACASNGKVGGYVHVPMGDNYINVELVHS